MTHKVSAILVMFSLAANGAFAFSSPDGCTPWATTDENLVGGIVSGVPREIVESNVYESDAKAIKISTRLFSNGRLIQEIKHQQPHPDYMENYTWSNDFDRLESIRGGEVKSTPGMKSKEKIVQDEFIQYFYDAGWVTKKIATDVLSGNVSSGEYVFHQQSPSKDTYVSVCLTFSRKNSTDSIKYSELDSSGRILVVAENLELAPHIHAQDDTVIYDYLHTIAAAGPTAVQSDYESREYLSENGSMKVLIYKGAGAMKKLVRVEWYNQQGWRVETVTKNYNGQEYRRGVRYTTDRLGNWITKQEMTYKILGTTQKYGWEPDGHFVKRSIKYE